MKFPYKKLSTGHTRPIIPIKISYGKNSATGFFALIDSGADMCLFPLEIAEEIGIDDVKSGVAHDVFGIDGKMEKYYVHPVSINIGGWDFYIEAGFMPNLAKMGYGILGHKGFFDQFSWIKFDYRKREIEIKYP